jgi:hypothetical protein
MRWLIWERAHRVSMVLMKAFDVVVLGRRSLYAVEGGRVVSGDWCRKLSMLGSRPFLTLVSMDVQVPKEVPWSLTRNTIGERHGTAFMKKR